MSLDTYFCICCLSTDDLSHLIDKNYSTVLQELFLIKPSEADLDENYICVDCATKMMVCYEFKQQIHDSLKTLRTLGLINLIMDKNNLVVERIKNPNENEDANSLNTSINLSPHLSQEATSQKPVTHSVKKSKTSLNLTKLKDTTKLNTKISNTVTDNIEKTNFSNIKLDNIERTYLVLDNMERTGLCNIEPHSIETNHLSNILADNLEQRTNVGKIELHTVKRINIRKIELLNIERTNLTNIQLHTKETAHLDTMERTHLDNIERTDHANIELDNSERTLLGSITNSKIKELKEENKAVFKRVKEETVQPFPTNEFNSLSDRDGDSSVNHCYEVTDDLSCKFCEWTASNVYCFHLHMNKHFPNHVCEICGKGFVTETRLKRHKYTHENGPYVCPECGKMYSNYNTFSDHKSRHYAKRKYACRICCESFQSMHARLKHSAEVHNQERFYSCEHCPKKFSTTGLLNSHVRYTHLKVRRHHCQLCLAAFCNKQDLDGHMTSHTGQKPYSCDECGNCYSHKKALRVHQQKHTDTKRFSCEICHKRFLQKVTLNCHLKTHNKKTQKPTERGEI